MKNLKKIVSIITVIMLLSFNCMVFAVNQSDLTDIDQKIKETEKEKEAVKAEKSEVLKQVESLTVEISEYQTQIDSLDGQLTELNSSIATEKENLEKAQKEYEEKKKLFEERLVAMYEAGETSYLDVLFNSTSLTDFISNYYIISEIASYDSELIDKIEAQKNEIEQAKAKLENQKNEVETIKKNKEQTAASLRTAQVTKNTYANQLSEEEKQLQAELEQFEKDKREIQAELARIAAQSSGSNTSNIVSQPSSSGYIFPVAGLNRNNINNKSYPSYRGHTGIDVNINVIGKTIVAVKSGTVVTSKALRYSNGNYRSYGEYIVINHHDGTMTLYAHGLAGSRKVVEGQSVSQGQALMTVGSTGNSTGPHLHFEVRVNGSPVNPLPYLP